MKREPGLCRQICAFSRATSAARFELFVNQRAQHREQQGHQQRRRAALAGDVADGHDDPLFRIAMSGSTS